jgi:hypothetical protein
MSANRPPVTPQAAPAQRSGCLTAVYVALGLGLLMLLATGIGIWVFLRSETGQRVMEAAREGITHAREAASAPGTGALRGAGCDQAMVLPLGRIFEILGVTPGSRGGRSGTRRLPSETVVLCQLSRLDAGPDCAGVARVYADAVPTAPERFAVLVQALGGRSKCEGIYAPDGSFLESLDLQ